MKRPVSRGAPIELEQTVREVMDRYPAAQKVFARHGLDMCCGGIHPVRVAAQAKGLDPEVLLAELNAAARGEEP